jgi:hypothetical protein
MGTSSSEPTLERRAAFCPGEGAAWDWGLPLCVRQDVRGEVAIELEERNRLTLPFEGSGCPISAQAPVGAPEVRIPEIGAEVTTVGTEDRLLAWEGTRPRPPESAERNCPVHRQ